MSSPAIFICYRRQDSNAAAYAIYDRLKVAFGESAVFLDHFDFTPGEDWRDETRLAIERARAVVVVVHEQWFSLALERFKDSSDPVRRELELAHRLSDKLVLPLAIDDAKIPSATEIDALRSWDMPAVQLLSWLFAKTALRIRFDRSFESDMQQVIAALHGQPGVDLPGRRKAIDVEIPAHRSRTRQILFGVLGVGLVVGGLLIGKVIPWPSRGAGSATTPGSGTSAGSGTPAGRESSAGTEKRADNAPPSGSCPDTSPWSDVAADRVVEIESGGLVTVLRADQPKTAAAAIIVTDGGKRAGAVRFRFYASGTLFKIEQVVDAECQPATKYRNPDRDDRDTLQNWDTLEMQLGEKTFSARFGYDAGLVSVLVRRVVK